MKEISFNAPNFGSFSQRQNQNLEGLSRGIGQFANGIGRAYDSYRDEQENKRKWDDMLAQRQHQYERERIADERYNREQEYINAERQRVAAEREARYKGMALNKQAMQDYFGAYGNQFDADYEKEMQDLDNFEQRNFVDDAASIRYGREVNGARTRARNLVASPMDYETMQYTPGGYVGNSNGSVGVADVGRGDTGNQQPHYMDLSRYGEGAMMAYNMMQNATNPDDFYAAQNHLFNIINQQRAVEMQKGEAETIKRQNGVDDQIAGAVALHPVMSTVNRLAAGMPDREYTPDDVRTMISTLEGLERYSMNIQDTAKRMEVQNKIDKAYANLQSLYGKKTAPGVRRK